VAADKLTYREDVGEFPREVANSEMTTPHNPNAGWELVRAEDLELETVSLHGSLVGGKSATRWKNEAKGGLLTR
jgi:hypothetical protein